MGVLALPEPGPDLIRSPLGPQGTAGRPKATAVLTPSWAAGHSLWLPISLSLSLRSACTSLCQLSLGLSCVYLSMSVSLSVFLGLHPTHSTGHCEGRVGLGEA